MAFWSCDIAAMVHGHPYMLLCMDETTVLEQLSRNFANDLDRSPEEKAKLITFGPMSYLDHDLCAPCARPIIK